jgi:hypothetical protein
MPMNYQSESKRIILTYIEVIFKRECLPPTNLNNALNAFLKVMTQQLKLVLREGSANMSIADVYSVIETN